MPAKLTDLPLNGKQTRVRIHFVEADPNGSMVMGEGPLWPVQRRYRMACDPHFVWNGNVPHTNDIRAATCPECLAAKHPGVSAAPAPPDPLPPPAIVRGDPGPRNSETEKVQVS